MLSVEKNVYMARLAEQAERYEEMVDFMKSVVNEESTLGVEVRTLRELSYFTAATPPFARL